MAGFICNYGRMWAHRGHAPYCVVTVPTMAKAEAGLSKSQVNRAGNSLRGFFASKDRPKLADELPDELREPSKRYLRGEPRTASR